MDRHFYIKTHEHLHQASFGQGGHMNIIEYLITELDCNPTILDKMMAIFHYTLLVVMAIT